MRIPVLLRWLEEKEEREEERHSIMGECFAHGIMASDVLETAGGGGERYRCVDYPCLI